MATINSYFPRFADGDVEIHLSEKPEDVFVLHSFVLALHSPFMKASLSDRWSKKEGGKVRWIYHLATDNEGSISILIKCNGESSKNDQTKTKPNNATGPRSGPRLVNPTKSIWTADSTTKAVANAHKQLLGAFYHIPPTFVNERWSFQSQISKLLTLAEIADMYGCSHLVNLPIENYIHQYQFLVSSLCSTKPVDMLGLSLKLKSDWIFKEATIVIVGHDAPTFEQAQKKIDTMGTGMSEFIERKRAEFVEKLHDVDHDLLRLESYSSRQGPAKKMHFIATAFFGMVLKDRLDNDLGSALGAGYAKLYHEMTHGRWYTAHELHSFLATFDLKSFAEGNGESFLDEITSKAAEALGDVLGNSPVWSFKEEAPQLRCIEVSEDELPWKKSTD